MPMIQSQHSSSSSSSSSTSPSVIITPSPPTCATSVDCDDVTTFLIREDRGHELDHLSASVRAQLSRHITQLRLRHAMFLYEMNMGFYQLTQSPYHIRYGSVIFWTIVAKITKCSTDDHHMRVSTKCGYLFVKWLSEHNRNDDYVRVMDRLRWSAITQLREEILKNSTQLDELLCKAIDLHTNNVKQRITGKTVYDVMGWRKQTLQQIHILMPPVPPPTPTSSSSPIPLPSLPTSSPSSLPLPIPVRSDSASTDEVTEGNTRSNRLLLAKAAQQRAMNQMNNAAAQCISSHQQEYDEAMIDRSEDVAMMEQLSGN